MKAKRTVRGIAYIKAHSREWNRKFSLSPKGRAKIKRHQMWNKRLLRAAKDNPCMDCGNSYPYYVMHFDHVRGTKSCAVSAIKRGVTRLLREIAKCDLVCSNCHAIRTWTRGQHWAK